MGDGIIRSSVIEEFADLYNDAYRYLIYYSGRSTGKSYAVAQSQIIRGLSQPLRFLDCREVQASIDDSVKSLLEQLINDMGLSQYFTIKRDEIICKTSGSKWAFTGLYNDDQKIKSMTGFDEAWVEEAQSISHRSLMTLLPTIRAEGSRFIFTMNRLTDADPVYTYFRETPPPRTLMKYIDPYTLDKYGLQPKEIVELRESEKGSIDYDHIWLGEPLSQVENAIINRKRLIQAFEREIDDDGAWNIGVDVARFGQDRTVFVARKGMTVKTIDIWQHKSLTEQFELLSAFVKSGMKDPRIKIDSTGVGGGLVDICRANGMDVIDINFASKPKDPDKYPNKASEMWFDFANILDEVVLSMVCDKRQELVSELSQRSWTFDNRGRRVIEQKSAFKAGGNRSPDIADALLLSFYEPPAEHVIKWW